MHEQSSSDRLGPRRLQPDRREGGRGGPRLLKVAVEA
jgi:hypothetical protein